MIKYYLIYCIDGYNRDEEDIHAEFDEEEELISFLYSKGSKITPVSLIRGERLTVSVEKKVSYSVGEFKESE